MRNYWTLSRSRVIYSGYWLGMCGEPSCGAFGDFFNCCSGLLFSEAYLAPLPVIKISKTYCYAFRI